MGDLLITVTTDSANVVVESNAAGTAETNNATCITRTSTSVPSARPGGVRRHGHGAVRPVVRRRPGDDRLEGGQRRRRDDERRHLGQHGQQLDRPDRPLVRRHLRQRRRHPRRRRRAQRGAGPGRGLHGTWVGHIPAGTSGTYSFLVKADHGAGQGAVFEDDDAKSNVAKSSPAARHRGGPVRATSPRRSPSRPPSGQIGQTIDLAWVVTNDAAHGLAATGNGPWYDRVVLSRDAVFGNADDINLGEFSHTGAVGLGASYTAAKTVGAAVRVLRRRHAVRRRRRPQQRLRVHF